MSMDREVGASMVKRLETGVTPNTNPKAIADPGASGEADPGSGTLERRRAAHPRPRRGGQKSLTGQMP